MHELERLIAGGESESLELKRSTAQLRRAGETLCAFLNGRGTNRVIEACERHGIESPAFEEDGESVTVTFRAAIAPAQQVTPQVTPQAAAVLRAARSPASRAELQDAAGLKDREHFRKGHLEPLLAAGLLEMTIPDKPRSSLQRYRTTAAGVRLLEETPE